MNICLRVREGKQHAQEHATASGWIGFNPESMLFFVLLLRGLEQLSTQLLSF